MSDWGKGIFIVVAVCLAAGLAGWGLPRLLSRRAEDPQSSRPEEVTLAVEQIFVRSCHECHGPDKQEAGLRLDDLKLLVQQHTVVPGDSAASLLLHMVSGDSPQMPPDAPLSADEVATLRRWVDEVLPTSPIASEALTSSHWAYRQVEKPAVPLPKSRHLDWCRSPVDRFVLARLEQEQLIPSPEADRATFIRRVSLDLIGLPPTLDEVDQFVSDPADDAHERLVDRLLSSPHFGEHWGRFWLDLARYADSHGYHRDMERQMWMYRDWVIAAFNRNLPFDQFTVEQLAGDLLPNPSGRQLVATGFHRNSMYNQEGGADEKEFRVKTIVDRVEVTSAVWLATTMQCAQCHNHPNEPISQREFYELFAFFNNSRDRGAGKGVAPLPIQMFPSESEKAEFDRLEALVIKRREHVVKEFGEVRDDEELEQLEMAHDKHMRQIRMTMVMGENAEPSETRLLLRGDFERPGPVVRPNVPRIWPRLSEKAPRNRLGLALWLVRPDNPLTARVAVNRFWEKLFGTGLVETSHDFGTQGMKPSHPELLDWLATEFMGFESREPNTTNRDRQGAKSRPQTQGSRNTQGTWDIKQTLRLIVTSATYRQTSVTTDDQLARDPRNRWLSRGPRFRLEAETIRDNALAISGLLTRQIGGPSVFPPQPAKLWKDIEINYENDLHWIDAVGPDRHRRGMYTFWRRSMIYPSFSLFDAPSREHCTVSRKRTNTPLQALVLLNDPAFTEAADALATRLITECRGTSADRVAYGLRLCLARTPTKDEVTVLLRLLDDERLAAHGDEHSACRVVASVLLNLHATISNW